MKPHIVNGPREAALVALEQEARAVEARAFDRAEQLRASGDEEGAGALEDLAVKIGEALDAWRADNNRYPR